jgi:hypothetical protein
MTGKTILRGLMALGLFASSTSTAFAEDEAPAQGGKGGLDFTISGSAGLVSDYRFRGVSQTDKHMAVQAGLTVMHKSGFTPAPGPPTLRAGASSAAPIWSWTSSAASPKPSRR